MPAIRYPFVKLVKCPLKGTTGQRKSICSDCGYAIRYASFGIAGCQAGGRAYTVIMPNTDGVPEVSSQPRC